MTTNGGTTGRRSRRRARSKVPIGWREWVKLPDLGVDAIKAKMDTGARTSALHAHDLEIARRNGIEIARFDVHPRQRSSTPAVRAVAEVLEWRDVRSSIGVRQRRPVIVTTIELGGLQWPIEVTLTNRDAMGFRLLLGRQALRTRFVVDPGRSFLMKEINGD